MRIVISGATGSIGSMLMARLAPSHEVVGLGRNQKKINEMAQRFSMKTCDLESGEFEQLMATLMSSSTVLPSLPRKEKPASFRRTLTLSTP